MFSLKRELGKLFCGLNVYNNALQKLRQSAIKKILKTDIE